MEETEKILPQHLAIIMDGNGRWAQQQGLSRSEGHRAGMHAVRLIIEECARLGIPYLTLYAFSRENWSRPAEEISFLFKLLVDFARNEIPVLSRENIRLQVLGELADLPFAARTALQHGLKSTAHCTGMHLNLAINYSGRDELVRAIRAMLAEGLSPDAVDESSLAAHLYTAGQPDPDLVIRTSGEIRLSNYLLYQCAYSELYFTQTLWPNFTTEDLHEALQSYAQRSRRFGRHQ